MRVDAFDYELPPERIAQEPSAQREEARLMVLPEEGGTIHATIGDLARFVPEGAVVVANNTRVIPARLLGVRAETGGKVEIFLVARLGPEDVELEPGKTVACEKWTALGKASKALKFGTLVKVGPLGIKLLGRREQDGLLEVALFTDDPSLSVHDAILAHGHVPLPPYIKRPDTTVDRDRYQTIFASVEGAVAAPTAGLHLTHALVGQLAAKGCDVVSLTLHVGLGTFQPVAAEDLDDHAMHSEDFVVSNATAQAIARARERGKPVVAIGTTVVRALESAADPDTPGLVRAGAGSTRLLIQPGYRFRVTDALLTNFHLPKSTLLAMVSAFAGTERVLGAYADAVREGYRFFSYGDAMFLHRRDA
jgi:S-adenosylmethionine:tRNA ribosyltransferase-isomerase